MIDNETQAATARSARRWGAGAALVAAGLAGGVILAGTVSANAASPSPSASSSTSTPAAGSGSTGGTTTIDPSKPQRPDEKLLTGTTAEKVRAAALAKYPGATIERVETNAGGVYEAHIVTTAGQHLIVEVGSDFAVTGTDTMGGGRGPGGSGPGGVDPDPNDNDGPGTSNPGGSQPGSGTGSGAGSATASPSA